MRTRPILFSAPMVLAILAGTKTQTRRILKQPKRKDGAKLLPELLRKIGVGSASPYDGLLWVKETWALEKRFDRRSPSKVPAGSRVHYLADGPKPAWAGRTRVSIHMTRWASRLTLSVSEVRIERLQEISEDDAKAEGAPMYVIGHGPVTMDDLRADPGYFAPNLYRHGYADIWESINGADSWATNPWVWVVEFKRLP